MTCSADGACCFAFAWCSVEEDRRALVFIKMCTVRSILLSTESVLKCRVRGHTPSPATKPGDTSEHVKRLEEQ